MIEHYRILVGAMVTTGLFLALFSSAPISGRSDKSIPPVLRFTVKDIDGQKVQLSKYRGNVVMIVNVASLCGNTPQYASLQKLYEDYNAEGFVILAFPANDFGRQEPGSNGEIKAFCTTHYRVTFPLFSKSVVKGAGQHPLYKFLTSKSTDPKFGGDIEWNFAKFLVSRKGEVVARFPAGEDPLKPNVVDAIKAEMSKPK